MLMKNCISFKRYFLLQVNIQFLSNTNKLYSFGIHMIYNSCMYITESKLKSNNRKNIHHIFFKKYFLLYMYAVATIM